MGWESIDKPRFLPDRRFHHIGVPLRLLRQDLGVHQVARSTVGVAALHRHHRREDAPRLPGVNVIKHFSFVTVDEAK